jgi:hypothetical protein
MKFYQVLIMIIVTVLVSLSFDLGWLFVTHVTAGLIAFVMLTWQSRLGPWTLSKTGVLTVCAVFGFFTLAYALTVLSEEEASRVRKY